ncbi:hypothetical protein Tco_0496953 [Tanacetum coccineum]
MYPVSPILISCQIEDSFCGDRSSWWWEGRDSWLGAKACLWFPISSLILSLAAFEGCGLLCFYLSRTFPARIDFSLDLLVSLMVMSMSSKAISFDPLTQQYEMLGFQGTFTDSLSLIYAVGFIRGWGVDGCRWIGVWWFLLDWDCFLGGALGEVRRADCVGPALEMSGCCEGTRVEHLGHSEGSGRGLCGGMYGCMVLGGSRRWWAVLACGFSAAVCALRVMAGLCLWGAGGLRRSVGAGLCSRAGCSVLASVRFGAAFGLALLAGALPGVYSGSQGRLGIFPGYGWVLVGVDLRVVYLRQGGG